MPTAHTHRPQIGASTPTHTDDGALLLWPDVKTVRIRMRPLPLVYHPAYSCPWPAQHRFPMWKFADLFSHLSELGLATDRSIHRPRDDPPHEWFETVHDPSYYRSFLDGTLGEKAERRIGFGLDTRKESLILRTRLEVSGTIKTIELAMQQGLAANLAGGTHHAHRAFGSGFTILNDLAIAAEWARAHLGVRRVSIVDLDVHQGDGTATLFESTPEVHTFSMHCGSNFPFRKARSDIDIDVPKDTGDEQYMQLLRGTLPQILTEHQPDLVLYDAGIDVFEGDQLGHLQLSHAGIYKRDTYVIDTCVAAGIPIACVIGGGYDRDARALARRHGLVHRAAAHVWARRRLG